MTTVSRMDNNGWTASQLDAMTAEDRKRIFEDDFVCDLSDAPPEKIHEALDKIKATLSA